jgi:hypothetical protein
LRNGATGSRKGLETILVFWKVMGYTKALRWISPLRSK